MTTVRDLIQDALIECNVIDPRQSLSNDEASRSMRVLNRMIQQWNSEGLMVYTVDRQLFNLVPGQQSYTLGTGGDFNVPRPMFIKMASVQDSSLARPVEIGIDILTDEEWRAVSVKNTPSTFPTVMWANGNVPLNTLYFWPVPTSSTYQVILYTWGRTSNFTSLDTVIAFPDGYEEAIVTNLAVRLGASYGAQVDGLLLSRARSAKSIVESMNLEPLFTSVDDALLRNRTTTSAIRSFGLVVDK